MVNLATSLGLGCLVGFLGAIPPGPVSVAVMHASERGRWGDALRVGFGGASVDVAICACIALGAGPLLAPLAAQPAVRIGLSAISIGLGVFVLVEALLRPQRRTATASGDEASGQVHVLAPIRSGPSYLKGLLRGVTNPSLVVNWTVVMAALTASGLLSAGRLAGSGFAVGVGLGVLGWFSLLARLVDRSRGPGPGTSSWVRAANMLAGAALMVSGGVTALR